ncbi:ABC transporter permease [Streptomyces hoynatensis]|uniref:ABC transporter permease n=1 Tax=Streptomyces hoynatensis TaxID=1141874 RepID=A0A3A9YKD5_9ACTN|nr:ABC transporter permease [Streptomyces hoynatensis]RKN37098.1 ABC transporter permease [Streptomyces hoynatensis]
MTTRNGTLTAGARAAGAAAPGAGAPPSGAPAPTRGTGFVRRHRYRLITAASLVVLLVVWEIVGRRMDPLFATYPTAIARTFKDELADGTLLTALWDSLKPLFLGYFLAAAAGIVIGMLVGRYRVVEAAVGLYITAGYSMPMVAFIPLFLLWFGLGFTVKVAVVVVMTIFPIIISTRAGVKAVPRSLVEVGNSFVAGEFALMRKIIFPATVPHIMTGLRLGIGRAVIGIVIAEFFTAIGGLGGLIILAGQRFDTAALFVPIVVLMVLGVGLTRLVGWLEGLVAPWQAGVSGGGDHD